MKRTLTHTTALILILSLCFSLAACATEENVVGTWEGEWSYMGVDRREILDIYEDGTYFEVIYRNGVYSSDEAGTWALDGRELELYHDGFITPFDIKGNSLIQDEIKLKKK